MLAIGGNRPALSRNQRWRDDIAYLASELPDKQAEECDLALAPAVTYPHGLTQEPVTDRVRADLIRAHG